MSDCTACELGLDVPRMKHGLDCPKRKTRGPNKPRSALLLVLVSTESEEPVWHIDADPGANYGTLCGLSVDDDLNEVKSRKPLRGQKCNCHSCYSVWSRVAQLRLRDDDFAEEAKTA